MNHVLSALRKEIDNIERSADLAHGASVPTAFDLPRCISSCRKMKLLIDAVQSAVDLVDPLPTKDDIDHHDRSTTA